MAEARRQAAEKRGRKGERLAALYLRAKGYRILDRRVRTPVGEVDLIAKRGNLVAFIEVKHRKTLDLALVSVPHQAWLRIDRASEFWMARRPALAGCGWRFDIVAVAPWQKPRHVRDAWRPGMA